MALPKSGRSTIVIIGASFSGAGVAHQLLKNAPQAEIILINPTDLWYFCFAAPRLLAKPHDALVNNETVLLSISDAFKQYPKSKFRFVMDSVTELDLDSKAVKLASGESISYDVVVVASGSTTPATIGKEEIPFKPLEGANNHLKAQILQAQQKILRAKSILVAGGGPVGVETAGEIAESYPDKKVTLICNSSRLLPMLKAGAGNNALLLLKQRGVEVLLNTTVKTAEPDAERKNWTVKLSDGKPERKVDGFISAYGTLPNTSFMQPHVLDRNGWVMVDNEMRIRGTEASGSAYALGDCTNLLPRTAISAEHQVPIVAENIKEVVYHKGKRSVYKPRTLIFMFVPIGSTGGTGQIWIVTLPNFIVRVIKAKDMLVSRARGFLYAK